MNALPPDDKTVLCPQWSRRLGGRRFWFLVALFALAVVGSACSFTSGSVDNGQAAVTRPATTNESEASPSTPSAEPSPNPVPTQVPPPPATATPVPPANPIALADTELPPAPIGFEALAVSDDGPQPIGIAIEDIGVSDAGIIPVGVNDDLTFEVPPADQVGWYEFGPAPGESGSAVLAAHIAYDGSDGVFRYLADAEIGAIVSVQFDDGSSRRFRIETVTDYFKEELPDSLFARDGREQLALITCGGTFNYQLDSYESNTVVVAVPI